MVEAVSEPEPQPRPRPEEEAALVQVVLCARPKGDKEEAGVLW